MEGTAAVKLCSHRNIPRSSALYAWCNRVDVIIASETIVRKRIAEHVPPTPPLRRSVSTPVEPGSACSDRAQQSQTNHSHFPGSFLHCVSHSFHRQGFVSIASLKKWKKLLYFCTFLLYIFLSSLLFSYYFPFLRGLWNMRHLEFLSYYASSDKNVYSTLAQNPQELHKCLVQDFGGLNSIVGLRLCVHSCYLFELPPPDHTRRIT